MGIHRLNPAGDQLEPSDLVPTEAFTTSDATELIHYDHLDENSGISSGVWKCAPCREEIDAYPVNEMMTVISGSVTITDDEGTPHTFSGGDTFFISKGTKCIWEITDTLHKFFMIAE
ncbi:MULTISPECIES: cupin domain-containing protein [Ruegeria]|uniref:cupin domain-containing protein n=1 Tax=Ruegeria TaxID=97050 RepID=UPI00147EBF2E|nr:cupin domain-containing protein [Ruegeria arenilitoris]